MDLFGVLMLSLTGALIGMFSAVPFTSISSDYNFVERLRSTFRIGYLLGTAGEAIDIIQPPNHPPNTWHKTLTYISGNLPEETDFISVDFEAIELQTETTTVIPKPTPNPTETVTVTVVATTTEVVYLPPEIETEGYTSSLTVNPTATSFSTRPSQEQETLVQPERTKIVRIIIPPEYFFGGDNPPPISLSHLVLEVAKELVSRVSHKFTRRTPPESSWYSPRIEKRHDAFIDGWAVMVLLGIPLTLLLIALSARRVRLRAVLEAGRSIKRRVVPMNNDREVAVHRVRTLNNILDDFTNGSNNTEYGTGRVQGGEEEEDVSVAAPPPPFSPSASLDPPLSFHANEVILRNRFNPFLDERFQLIEENMRSLSKVCAQLTRDVKNDFAEQKAQIRGLVERIELLDMNASEITFTKEQIEDQFTKFVDAKECIAQFLEKADGCLTYYSNYKEKMSDIKKTAKRHSTDIEAIGIAASSNSTNIKAIEMATNDNSTNIKDLEARIGYIKTHLGINMKEIKSDIKELQNTVHDIKADIKGLQGLQTGVDHIRNIQKGLNSIQEVIGADPENTKQFNRHAVKIAERLTRNNTKDIADLRTSTIDTNSGQNDATNIHSSINENQENAELRTSIKDTETRIENNTIEIQDFRRSVNGVETATGKQTNTVGKLQDSVSDIMWENLYDAESP